MSLPSRLLFDMNALRYLDQLGLLEVCISAIQDPYTLDLIRMQEMRKPTWEDVVLYGMRSCELSSEMMTEAVTLMSGSPKLSICDAGLIVLAKESGLPIVTEDGAMVKVMSRQKVLHVSVPEMVDLLVGAEIISREVAVGLFQRLSAELLPGCDERYPEIVGKYLRGDGMGGNDV